MEELTYVDALNKIQDLEEKIKLIQVKLYEEKVKTNKLRNQISMLKNRLMLAERNFKLNLQEEDI